MRRGLPLFWLLVLLVLAGPAVGQIYTYVDENGITVFTDRKPDTARYRVRNLGCYGTCRTGVDWERTPLLVGRFDAEIEAASEVFGVEAALIRAVVHAESWFETDAVSHAGAQGLMQLMPDTARRFGVIDVFDPVDNITGGAAYLAWLGEQFEQDFSRTVAAYNAGENAVKRHGGVPPYPETQEYVRRVRILYQRYREGS
ncbi:transglycosylase SLT domain-containing protein [Wenzhouxiangella limi]|uniref:Lytic transglycosylase domain-containing protein n=1 Tax=Wenzhouxiangella limi TaxID=2707351 RepID=A0A845UY32_9GAMM|nr:transglycosylase SLT domain-containing protein [Wenzhouxiangella limi]NDY96753.1 lytic transglycosylase domain-containing protein [Wenzhouxiangella limi]